MGEGGGRARAQGRGFCDATVTGHCRERARVRRGWWKEGRGGVALHAGRAPVLSFLAALTAAAAVACAAASCAAAAAAAVAAFTCAMAFVRAPLLGRPPWSAGVTLSPRSARCQAALR